MKKLLEEIRTKAINEIRIAIDGKITEGTEVWLIGEHKGRRAVESVFLFDVENGRAKFYLNLQTMGVNLRDLPRQIYDGEVELQLDLHK